MVPALQATADPKKRGAATGKIADGVSGVGSALYRIGVGEWVDVDLDIANAGCGRAVLRAASPGKATFAVDLNLGNEAAKVEFCAFDTAGNVTNSTMSFAEAPGGLSNIGTELGMSTGIAAATLLLIGSAAILVARRNCSKAANKEI